MDRIEELIKRVADLRKMAQRAQEVSNAAGKASREVSEAYDEAYADLRDEIRGRVDALAPLQEGDRIV